MTPNSEITFTLIFRAVGMALLTVPLTSLAVSSLPPENIPQGAALNNMMRQLGGSFGISFVNTYITRRTAAHRVSLISHLHVGNPAVSERYNAYISRFQQQGESFPEAHQKALKVFDMAVTKQSFLLSYLDAYLIIGILFIIALPLLILVVRRNKNAPTVIISDH